MLKICNISDSYIQYLRVVKGFTKVYDPEIATRLHERKYIGVLFEINKFNYFAPFSSPKRSDYLPDGSIRHSTLSIFRMVKNGSTPSSRVLLGTITLNNMIPVPLSEVIRYDINAETDINYKNLVIDEMRWIERNDSKLKTAAKNLYFLKVNEKERRTDRNGPTLDATIDFLSAEYACKEWIRTH